MRIQLFIFFMGLSISSFCQGFVEVVVSNKTPRVGDFFSITCTIRNQDFFPKPSDSSIYYPSSYLSSDSTMHQKVYNGLEIIGFQDTSFTLNSKKVSQRTYSIVAWDSCELSLDGFDYRLANKTIKSEKVYLNVSFYEPVEDIQMYDIKESFSSWKGKGSRSTILYWLFIILVLAMGLFVFIFWNKRFFKDRNMVLRILPLEERTLLDLQELYSEELWLHNKLQEHFVRFSYVLRSYLTERFEVSFLDKTTYQSKLLLKKIDLPESIRIKIGELLTASDFVKFADSSISNEHIAFLKIAVKNIVEETTSNSGQQHD
tara:strand:- start:263 stop:1210 length:948 start_codon:yes stop_codon:yes gene_type:complete